MRGDNLVIIGMPGSGKSTFGRALAEHRNVHFIDTDDSIAERYGYPLQSLVDQRGVMFTRRAEEDTICSLKCHSSVVSTGGSVIYSDTAMRHLAALGTLVYLAISLPTLLRRIDNSDARGLLRTPDLSLRELYWQRLPLYQRWAQVTLHNDWPSSAWHFSRLHHELTGAEQKLAAKECSA